MFVIEGCGTNETPQLGYLGGLVILAILGCFSATPRRGHVGCRTRESVAPSANRPSRCPKECPGIGRSNGLTASPWWTSSPERFSQIAWRFLVDLPLNQSIEKSEKNLEILGGIACKLCHCDSSIKLAKQIWRIQSCNLTHNHPKQNQKNLGRLLNVAWVLYITGAIDLPPTEWVWSETEIVRRHERCPNWKLTRGIWKAYNHNICIHIYIYTIIYETTKIQRPYHLMWLNLYDIPWLTGYNCLPLAGARLKKFIINRYHHHLII